jgi:hypothetical protein
MEGGDIVIIRSVSKRRGVVLFAGRGVGCGQLATGMRATRELWRAAFGVRRLVSRFDIHPSSRVIHHLHPATIEVLSTTLY